MTASIFTDPLRGAAILVSDDPIYALGPVLVADELDEATEAMMAFIAALEEDPSEMPTIRLMIEWQGFLGAITPGPLGVPGGQETGQEATEATTAGGSSPEPQVGRTPPDDGSEDAGESLPADLRVSEGLDVDQLATVAQGLDPDPEPEDEQDDPDELDLKERLASVPGGTPRQRGLVECFACQGTGHAIGQPENECNLCHGEGKILEPEPVATTTTEGDEQ